VRANMPANRSLRTMEKFRIGLTRDFLGPDGRLAFKDIGLGRLDRVAAIEYEFLPTRSPVATPEELRPYDAVIWLGPRVTRASLVGVERLVAIARFGVGYDNIDVAACTDADVLLFIARGAVNRPVAEAILTLMLALGHRLFLKDRLMREGRWAERGLYNGIELRDRVVGSVGLGGIGGELCRLLQPFGIRAFLAYDPYCPAERARELGAQLVPLAALLRESDFITINCPLNDETRGLIGARELTWVRPTAYLINTARGGIVDEDALYDALATGRLAGAAIDVWAEEPPTRRHPLLDLHQVIATPHAIAWTDELFRDNGRSNVAGLLRLFHGEPPDHLVNPEALARPGVQRKLARLRERFGHLPIPPPEA